MIGRPIASIAITITNRMQKKACMMHLSCAVYVRAYRFIHFTTLINVISFSMFFFFFCLHFGSDIVVVGCVSVCVFVCVCVYISRLSKVFSFCCRIFCFRYCLIAVVVCVCLYALISFYCLFKVSCVSFCLY